MHYLHHSAFLNSGLELVSKADVTVETKACFTVEQKRHKGIAVLRFEFV
jgi:hypothetical protein